MFYNPRSNPYYRSSNPYYGYAPQPAHPSSFLGDQRALARRRALEDARIRAAQQNPYRNPFGFHYPGTPSSYDDEEEDYYDRRHQEYLEAQRRKQAYEQELRRRQLEEQQRRQELEAEGAYNRTNAFQQRQHQNPQAGRAPTVHPVHRVPVFGPERHEASEIPVRQSQPSHAETPKSTPQAAPARSQEELDDAASKIQQAWHRRKALQKIKSIEEQFRSLKSPFTFPPTLDFQIPSSDGERHEVSVSSTVGWTITSPDEPSKAKLAFTKNNAPIHGYVESLSRLLVQLDSIESHGDKHIREKRKAVIKEVEKEAESVESRWRGIWAAYQAKQKQQTSKVEPSKREENGQGDVGYDSSSSDEDEFFEVEDMIVDPPAVRIAADTDMEDDSVFVSMPNTPQMLSKEITYGC